MHQNVLTCVSHCWRMMRSGCREREIYQAGKKSMGERYRERASKERKNAHIPAMCVNCNRRDGKIWKQFWNVINAKSSSAVEKMWWWENEQCAKAHLPLASMCQKYLAWRTYETQLECKRTKWTWFFYFSPSTCLRFAALLLCSTWPSVFGVSTALGFTRVNDSPSNSSNKAI